MFQNRQEAGKLLSKKLKAYKNDRSSIVLAIVRGGVVVGAEISKELNIPLEGIVVRKLGAPDNQELAIGAVSMLQTTYIDRDMVKSTGTGEDYYSFQISAKIREVEEMVNDLQISPDNLLKYSNFILTDDGIATGATIQAAILTINKLNFKENKKHKIVLAVPVASGDVLRIFKKKLGKIIVIEEAENFGSVGQYYSEFDQVDNEMVIKILNKYRRN